MANETQDPQVKAAKINRVGTILAALIGLIGISIQFIPISWKPVLNKSQTKNIISEYLSEASDSIVQVSMVDFFEKNKNLFVGPIGPSGLENLPVGTILPWTPKYGDLSVPSGWQIANGLNNTPNLKDRFLLGDNSGSPEQMTHINLARINEGTNLDLDIMVYKVVYIVKTK